MDPETPFARMERTFWTVWCFVSEAVSRFLRPQPVPGVSDEQNIHLESAGEAEPPEYEDAECDIHPGEDALVAASLLSSPHAALDGERSVTEGDFQPEEDTVQQKTPPSECGDGNESNEAAEEPLDRTGLDDAVLLSTKDARQQEEEEAQVRPLQSCQVTSEDDKHEQHAESGSKTLTDDVIGEKIKKSEVQTVCTIDVHQETFEARDDEGYQHTIPYWGPEGNDSIHKENTAQNCESETLMLTKDEAEDGFNVQEAEQKMEADEETANQLNAQRDFTDTVGVVSVIGMRSENDELEEEPRWSVDKKEQRAVSGEENLNDDAHLEASVLHTQTLLEDGQEEKVPSEHVACPDSPVESEKQLYAAEFTEKEPEDLAVTELPTDTRQTDVKLSDAAADLRFTPECPAEETFCMNEEGEEGLAEKLQTTSAATVNLEGETRQEIGRELQSFPLGTSEGRVVVSEELNAPACEETQGGLPENNNESGQDENTTRRFLEVDCEEFQSVQLPEEVESRDQESPQNPEAACFLTSESLEEHQESGDDTETTVRLSEAEQIGILPLLNPESSETEKQFPEEAIQESPMKTEVRDFRMLDGTETDSHGYGADDVLSSSKEAAQNIHEAKRGSPEEEATEFTDEKAEDEDVTRTSLSQDIFHTTLYSDNSLESVSAPECRTHSAESVAEVHDDRTVDELDNSDTVDGIGKGAEYDPADTGLLAPMAGELITPSEGDEDAFLKQSVLSTQVEIGEIKTSEIETKETVNNERTDDLTVTESKAEDLFDVSTEHVSESQRAYPDGTSSSIGGHQDLIDEEILDLWMEAAMSSPNQPNLEETETSGAYLFNEASAGSQEEETQKDRSESKETETGLQDDDMTGKAREEADVASSVSSGDERLEVTAYDSDEVTQSKLGPSRSSLEASSEDGSQGDEELNILSPEEQQLGDADESSPSRSDAAPQPMGTLEDQTESDGPVLDFSPQRLRISLKNPRVRPPNNPRQLLNMPSLEPTSSAPAPVKLPAGVPLGALGVGIKLPGLGGGFPLLKKTPRTAKDEDHQEAEMKPEEKSDAATEEETPRKPKWMPPKHPGFGNPLMSELKTKLKKTSTE